MPKTIHTPEAPRLGELILPQTKLAEFRRVDATSATAKFHVNLAARSIPKLFAHLGWTLPGETQTKDDFETKLKGGNFILTGDTEETIVTKSKDKKVDTSAELDIDYLQADSFQVLRMEIEGRKGKGFRRELRFTVKSKEEDFCAQLESFMQQTGGKRATLRIRYLPEPVQTTTEEVSAMDEQRQASLEIPVN